MYNNGTTISITAANMQRRYILNVPTNYDNTKPYKLIIAWHQLDGNDKQMYANGYYHLLNLSGNSAIFVAPNGQEERHALHGDWKRGERVRMAELEQFETSRSPTRSSPRSKRTSASTRIGSSRRAGATGAACRTDTRARGRWAGRRAGYVRAVAVYSGAQLSGNCTPTKPVAYYASHGTTIPC